MLRGGGGGGGESDCRRNKPHSYKEAGILMLLEDCGCELSGVHELNYGVTLDNFDN